MFKVLISTAFFGLGTVTASDANVTVTMKIDPFTDEEIYEVEFQKIAMRPINFVCGSGEVKMANYQTDGDIGTAIRQLKESMQAQAVGEDIVVSMDMRSNKDEIHTLEFIVVPDSLFPNLTPIDKQNFGQILFSADDRLAARYEGHVNEYTSLHNRVPDNFYLAEKACLG